MTTKQSEATQNVAVRSFRKGGKTGLLDKLDLKRILAMSAVMVMHAMAIGLMLLPAVPIAAIALPPPEPAWVDVTEPPPPPPPPPPPLPPEPVRPVVPSVVKVQPIIAPPPVAPAVKAPDLIATTREPSPEIGIMSPTIVEPLAAVGGTVSESILKVLRAPPPPFPQSLIRSGFSGTVEFSVLVGVEGIAQEIKLMKSSGNRKLDQSTLSHIKRHWRFKAPEIDGQTVPGWGRGKIAFTLEA